MGPILLKKSLILIKNHKIINKNIEVVKFEIRAKNTNLEIRQQIQEISLTNNKHGLFFLKMIKILIKI